jgi:hypothetical protein
MVLALPRHFSPLDSNGSIISFQLELHAPCTNTTPGRRVDALMFDLFMPDLSALLPERGGFAASR